MQYSSYAYETEYCGASFDWFSRDQFVIFLRLSSNVNEHKAQLPRQSKRSELYRRAEIITLSGKRCWISSASLQTCRDEVY